MLILCASQSCVSRWRNEQYHKRDFLSVAIHSMGALVHHLTQAVVIS